MVDLKTAYQILNDFFLKNDSDGVYEARETNDNWLFEGKCKGTCYGTVEVCVPKNGDGPYVFSATDTDGVIMWSNAKVVSL